MEAPVKTPTTHPSPERVRRLSPDEECGAQKERVTREVEKYV